MPDHAEPLSRGQDVPFTPLRHSKDIGENGQWGSMSPPSTKAVSVRVQSPRECMGCGPGKLVLVLMFKCRGEFRLFGFFVVVNPVFYLWFEGNYLLRSRLA